MDLDRYKTLTLTRDGRILTIAIDNGPINAVDDDLHHELGHVFVDAQDDQESDLIVLTGAGRAFCAGGDMAWFQDMIDDTSRFRGILPDANRIIMTLLDLEKLEGLSPPVSNWCKTPARAATRAAPTIDRVTTGSPPQWLHPTRGERMKKAPSRTLTDRQAAEIESLAALPDDQIDTSDIPEIVDWSDARRGLLCRPVKNRVLRKGG